MNAATASIRFFGVYLVILGAALIVAPNAVLVPFGLPPTTEVWLRVVGVLATVLGFYYRHAARGELVSFYRATIVARVLVFVSFGAFVLLGFAKPALALFGAVDLAGAVWTATALRRG
ncbi:MAG: hypothetical protein WCC53_11555 [Thermoanaerobaculia bacterium]|jgi:hypothetical protein